MEVLLVRIVRLKSLAELFLQVLGQVLRLPPLFLNWGGHLRLLIPFGGRILGLLTILS